MTVAVRLTAFAILAFICAAAKNSKADVCIREKAPPNLGSPKNEITGKVAGGSPVPDGRYPYVVSLRELFGKDSRNQKDFRYFCGAALISPDWAITAASCVDAKLGVENPAVFGGTIWREGPFTELSFSSKTFLHPGWVSRPLARAGFDVALVKLPCPSNLPTIKLPPKDFKPGLGDALWAIGWGRTGRSSPFVDRLNEVELQSTDPRKCSRVLGFRLVKSLICAGESIADVCQGDTGGPLVSKGKSFKEDVLVGTSPELLSNCDFLGKPVIFTSVVAVRDWIDETIAANSKPTAAKTKPTAAKTKPTAAKTKTVKADPDPVFGLDIVKGLKKGSTEQPKAAELIGIAAEQDRVFAVEGAVRISAKRGLAEELSMAIVEAIENGVDEDVLKSALELALEVLGD